MRRALFALPFALAISASAHADYVPRGLLVPSARGPVRVVAGERLSMVVRVASGLTPPPGVQTERALRGFSARVCAGPACTPLEVRNVRPVDAHSFDYRVEAPVPSDTPPGVYDLELRFPGGSSRVERSVRIAPAAARAPIETAGPAGGVSCALASGAPSGFLHGLLALALSWKLAARRRRPAGRWNTSRRTPVSDWS